MSVVPPLHPRRKVPPPPRRPTSTARSVSAQNPIQNSSVDSTPAPAGGIAARIAALKLDQVGGGGAKPAPPGRPPTLRTVSAPPRSNAKPGHTNQPNGVEYTPKVDVKASPRLNGANGHCKPTFNTDAKALRRPPPPLPPRRATMPSPPPEEEEEPVKIHPTPPRPPPRKVPTLPARRGTAQVPLEEPVEEGEDSPPPPPRRLPPRTSRSLTADPEPGAPPPPPVNRTSRPPVPTHTRPVLPPRGPTPEPEPEPEPEYEPEIEYAEEVAAPPGAETCLKCRSFEEVDAHAALFPRQNVYSLEHLAYDLTSLFDSLTDKARAIFTWLHHNITYDVVSFFNHDIKPSTPESTLRSGLAVCEGFAGLFSNLALQSGLQSLVINGHGKGFGYVAPEGEVSEVPPYEMNHAWNAVVMDDNQWHLIDSCWGAGALTGEGYQRTFAPRWFTSTNEEFGKRHYPTEEEYQMREDGTVQSWADYVLAAPGPTEFGHFDMQGYMGETLWPNTKCIAGGYQHTFHIEKLCWHMERRDWWVDYVLMVVACRSREGSGVDGKREIMQRDAEGGWTATLDVPAGEGMVTMFLITTMNGREGKGLDPGEVKNLLGRSAMAFQGVARWDVL